MHKWDCLDSDKAKAQQKAGSRFRADWTRKKRYYGRVRVHRDAIDELAADIHVSTA